MVTDGEKEPGETQRVAQADTPHFSSSQGQEESTASLEEHPGPCPWRAVTSRSAPEWEEAAVQRGENGRIALR